MPGTITFKPIEANLNVDTDLIGKADPYCMFLVNGQKIKGQTSKSGGKHPVWEDAVTIPASNQPTCFVEIKDKDILKDDKLGSFEIDLREIESQGRLRKWYPIFHKDRPAGEILMEATFSPQGGLQQTMPLGQAMPIQTQGIQQPTLTQHQPILTQHKPVQIVESHIIHPQQPTLISGAPLASQQHFQQVPGMMQSNPYGGTSMHGSGYPMGESLSEHYAKEALMRGVDPLGTHLHQHPEQMFGGTNYVGGTHPVPQLNANLPGGLTHSVQVPGQQLQGQQLLGQQLPGQQLLGQQLPGQQLLGQSEHYAKEALMRGVDPLGTHLHQHPEQMFGGTSYVGGSHPIPQLNANLPGGLTHSVQMPGQQLPGQQLPGQQLLGQQLSGQQLLGQQLPGQQLAGQSEHYAKEALMRGVDPLGTHLHQHPEQMFGGTSYVGGTHPVPQMNANLPGGLTHSVQVPGQQLPGQQLLQGQHLPGQINQNTIL